MNEWKKKMKCFFISFQDHESDHMEDNENWSMYQTNVVDFLRERCQVQFSLVIRGC